VNQVGLRALQKNWPAYGEKPNIKGGLRTNGIMIMPHSNATSPRLMKPKEAAEYLAISERKLWSLSKSQAIPVVRMGRSVRYDKRDLDSFIFQAKGALI
jgi:excisionase family DNA binding protein